MGQVPEIDTKDSSTIHCSTREENLLTDSLTRQRRSEVMARIRAKGNRATELRLVTILREHSITGRRRSQSLPGKPDFTFRKERVAVFVDGYFWHGCRWHCSVPKTKQEYWQPKIARNKARDQEVNKALRDAGWLVHRIWEHALDDPDAVARKLKFVLQKARDKGRRAT